MNDEKVSFAVLIIVSLFAVVSVAIVLSPANTGYSFKELKREAVQDQTDYAYSRIGYAQGIPPRSVNKAVSRIPSLFDKTERIQPIPSRGLDRTGHAYVTAESEENALWKKRQGFEKDVSKRFFQ